MNKQDGIGKMACERCGFIPKRTPKLHSIEVPHPKGGVTVLGRKVELVAEVLCWECPKCHRQHCEGVRLPLDPDAMLIREVFDVDDGDVSFEDVVAYLKDNKISVNDLEELAQLKHDKGTLVSTLEWFKKKGLVPAVIVPHGMNQPNDTILEKLKEQGIPVEEAVANESHLPKASGITFLRPPE
jgi:hypothetical protein